MRIPTLTFAAILLGSLPFDAHADAVTGWNATAGHLVAESKIGTPPAARVMAIVQTAVHEAVRAVAHVDAAQVQPSVDAAVAAANRVTLLELIPSQQAHIEWVYEEAMASIEEGPAKVAGIRAGESAAAAALHRHALESD